MRKIKIAIIGCGRIFDKHKTAIEKLNQQFEIESVCDLALDKIKKKIFLKKIKMYNSIDKLCKNSKANLIAILTPSGLHYNHITKVSNYFKNIIVEKPMVMNTDQSKKITGICNKKKNKLIYCKTK